MDVLYINKNGNETLRYSLRSVEKYINPDNVYIAGFKPQWATNIKHVEVQDKPNRYEDALNKLHAATHEIASHKLILMHDDMFLLKDYKPVLRHNGLLKDYMRRTAGDRKKLFDNTVDMLDDGLANYALHYPLPFRRTKMRDLFEMSQQPFSYMNAYGNIDTDFRHIKSEDCKLNGLAVNERHLEGMECFSTYNECNNLYNLLEQLFNHKSRYET